MPKTCLKNTEVITKLLGIKDRLVLRTSCSQSATVVNTENCYQEKLR